jgi:LuxR family quorum sensing-dependent transcriptional regulator
LHIGIASLKRVAETAAMGAALFNDFGHSIASCRTPDEVGDQYRKEVARHGYTASACRAFVPSAAGARSSVLLFRNWTQDWTKFSEQKGFTANSFAIIEARRRMSPFTWRDVPKARALSAGEQEVWNAVLAWGWNNGFVLPVHGPGGYFATVSMASPERDLDLGHGNRAHLQMIATLAHERCRALANLAFAASPLAAMSARELECLRWVAAGKTDWEIGMILSISAATVKFHVNGARAKLGARTRAQAVAQLVLAGLY